MGPAYRNPEYCLKFCRCCTPGRLCTSSLSLSDCVTAAVATDIAHSNVTRYHTDVLINGKKATLYFINLLWFQRAAIFPFCVIFLVDYLLAHRIKDQFALHCCSLPAFSWIFLHQRPLIASDGPILMYSCALPLQACVYMWAWILLGVKSKAMPV